MLCKIRNEVIMMQSGEIMDCAKQRDSGEPSIPYALITRRQADMVSNSQIPGNRSAAVTTTFLCIAKHLI